MIRRPPRSTLSSSSAASDVYKRQAIALLLRTQRRRRAQGDHELDDFVEPEPSGGFAQVRGGGACAKVRAVAQAHDQGGHRGIVLDQVSHLINVHVRFVEQFDQRHQVPWERRQVVDILDERFDAQHKFTSWVMPETLSEMRPVSTDRPMVRLTWPPISSAFERRFSRRSQSAKAARLRSPILNTLWSSMMRAPPARKIRKRRLSARIWHIPRNSAAIPVS